MTYQKNHRVVHHLCRSSREFDVLIFTSPTLLAWRLECLSQQRALPDTKDLIAADQCARRTQVEKSYSPSPRSRQVQQLDQHVWANDYRTRCITLSNLKIPALTSVSRSPVFSKPDHDSRKPSPPTAKPLSRPIDSCGRPTTKYDRLSGPRHTTERAAAGASIPITIREPSS